MGAEVRRRTPGVKQGLQVLTRRTGFGLASTVGADRASGGCVATEISRAVRVRGWVWTREGARAWREGGWRVRRVPQTSNLVVTFHTVAAMTPLRRGG